MNRIFWIKDSSQQPGDDNDLDDQQNAGKKTDDLSKKSTKMRVINTNARSLCPKIDSLVDVMEESDASLAVVTETWLKDGDRLDEDVDGLSRGAGIGMLYKNRKPLQNGVSYGGVAILLDERIGSFKKAKVNDRGHEVSVAAGSIKGHSRKLVVIACYLPPILTRKLLRTV